MDSLQLTEEIKQLQKLRQHYEEQLNIFGIQMNDLPSEVQALLNECVDLQKVTNLHDLRLPCLKAFYYNKKKDHIENTAIIQKLQNDVQQQKEELEKEEAECSTLEKLLAVSSKRLVSETEMETNKIMLEKSKKSLEDRLAAINIPQDFNINELINKVELLNKAMKKGNNLN